MRVLSLFILFAAWPSASLAENAGAADRLFREGNQLLQQGNMRAAIALYEEVTQTGYASAALYYNMGNAYLSKERYPEAILYYLRAQRFDANDERVAHNLYIAQDRLNVLPPPQTHTPVQRIINATLQAVEGQSLYMLLYACYVLLAGLAGAAIWQGRFKAWHRRVMYVFLPLFLILASLALYGQIFGGTQNVGVIMSDGTSRSPSADEASEFVEVPRGSVVHVLEHSNDRARVRLPNGLVAWISAGNVAEV